MAVETIYTNAAGTKIGFDDATDKLFITVLGVSHEISGGSSSVGEIDGGSASSTFEYEIDGGSA